MPEFHTDIRQKQMAADEQAVVLRSLAETVIRPGFRLLEVGSWCGDSAMVLGAVAKHHGGHLYCVDWWKGNVGTDLEHIANRNDVFSIFWERVRAGGLEDTIIPIRGRSEDVHGILAVAGFDLVYLDGDHRYDAFKRDLEGFAPLVRDGGILCGDDCEGSLEDFDSTFLELGKGQDFFESVHCGVVLAVGQRFPAYSIDYNIWSVRRKGTSWLPTDVSFQGIAKKRQVPPPLLEARGHYNILRFGRTLYAIPHSLGPVDITDEKTRERTEILTAPTLESAREKVDMTMFDAGAKGSQSDEVGAQKRPRLIGSIFGYKIVRYEGAIYGIDRSLGAIDLSRQQTEPNAPGIRIGQTIPAVLWAILWGKAGRLFRAIERRLRKH